MDYKEKYEQALAKAKDMLNYKEVRQEDMEYLFPELKESEDERIRKAIINTLSEYGYLTKSTIKACDAIAWLEKQSKENMIEALRPEYEKGKSDVLQEQRKEWTSEDLLNRNEIMDILQEYNRDDLIAWLEKQDNEPKWCHHKVDLSDCSDEYRKAYYDGWNNCNMQHSQRLSEGNDVVKCLINGMKFYYEGNEEATWGTEKFSMKVKDILNWLERQGEQKLVTIDIDKMVDDYANNNERGNEEFGNPVNCMIRAYRQGLNDAIGKVVLNPAWLEKQGEQKHGIPELTKQKLNTLLNEALQKETPESWNEFLEQSTAWSEEDEVKINRIVACLKNLKVADNDILLKDVDWLKSLRPQSRWKPSDEQMIALRDVISGCSYDIEPLVELETKLKEL